MSLYRSYNTASATETNLYTQGKIDKEQIYTHRVDSIQGYSNKTMNVYILQEVLKVLYFKLTSFTSSSIHVETVYATTVLLIFDLTLG